MAFSRANYVLGPARIVRGSGTVFSKAGATVRLDPETIPINIDGYGKIDERVTDAMVKLSFTPEGRWNSATRGLLWPYLNPTLPFAIFGATDTPTVLHTSESHLHTIVASAITKMPSIRLSAKETMIGEAEITGVRKLASDWATADSLYIAATSGGTYTDSAFVTTDIKVQTYTGAWGAVGGYTAITTEDGWTIDFDADIDFRVVDDIGTVAAYLQSVSVMAKCVPLATSWANIEAALKIQSTGAARGRSLAAGGADLAITGADASVPVTLKNANIKMAGYRFGTNVLRDGEAGWVATRSFASGVAAAFCTLA